MTDDAHPVRARGDNRRRHRRGHIGCRRPASAHHAVGRQPAHQDPRGAARQGSPGSVEAGAADAAGAAIVRLARQGRAARARRDRRARRRRRGAARITDALAVNADSLATWFLEPLARLSQRHPVVFELHRDDQDFTAGLLESGTVMGAVTSRATPVAGCRVSALGADAVRGGRDSRVRRAMVSGRRRCAAAGGWRPVGRLRPS